MRGVIKFELSDYLMEYHIIKKYNFKEYVTTVKNLLNIYEKNENNKSNSIFDLLTKLIEDDEPSVGNYWDDVWNHGCNDFNKKDFNYYVEQHLTEMLDRLEEMIEENPNYQELRKMNEVVNKMGGFGRWLDTPKENRRIKFFKINFGDGNKVLEFLITKKGGHNHPDYDGSLESISEKRSVSNMEELNNALYHPELFENIKKHLNKFLIIK
jgi:hypothetical protein